MSPQKPAKKKSDLDTGQIIKWLVIAVMGLLFIVGVIVMVDNRDATTVDPRAQMLKEMGLDQAIAAAPPESPLGVALRRLSSGDPTERVAGIAAAMDADAAAASGAVRGLLADPAPTVRAAAIAALAAKKVPSCGSVIVQSLMDPDESVRKAAVAAIQAAYLDEPGLMYQVQSPLGSRDPAVVTSAIAVWMRLAPKDLAVAARVIETPLYSEDDAILSAALDAVAALGPENIARFRSRLESIAASRAGTPHGEKARALLEQMTPVSPTPG